MFTNDGRVRRYLRKNPVEAVMALALRFLTRLGEFSENLKHSKTRGGSWHACDVQVTDNWK